MFVLLMEPVCLVGHDMDGNAARDGSVELCRHGSVALYSLDFRPKPWRWCKSAENGRLTSRRRVFIRQARPPLSKRASPPADSPSIC